MVKHDVEPKQLEAHIVGKIIRLAGSICVRQDRLHRDNRFNNDLTDVIPDQSGVHTYLFQFAKNSSQGSFVADVHPLMALVEFEF